MRPLRLLLTVTFCIAAFSFLVFVGPWRAQTQLDYRSRTSIGTYLSWRTPSSLFPPSAIISLTDDNSTFFLARPAAFGSLLPSKSLSGQLWIGSGFGADRLGHGGYGAGAEGELGCSDVPGWNDGNYRAGYGNARKSYNEAKSGNADAIAGGSRRLTRKVNTEESPESSAKTSSHPSEDDGTDDYLHHPLPASDGLKTNGDPAGSTKKPTHADIQSLQESAEIAGKIVLLSRGGCGFLEKAKWVQRRGGIALIVGDDVRGGPLVTMYARGDTSNVTIPSLFTSHTTAHLLSSLIPAGGGIGDISESTRLGYALGDLMDDAKTRKTESDTVDKPNFTSMATAGKPTSTALAKQSGKSTSKGNTDTNRPSQASASQRGWFWNIFGDGASSSSRQDSRRPPSSGNIGWVLQEEPEDVPTTNAKTEKHDPPSLSKPNLADPEANLFGENDGFVIGVQDWRDPDLVAQQKEQHRLKNAKSTSTSSTSTSARKSPAPNALKGGSITPGSGEYVKSDHLIEDVSNLGTVLAKASAAMQLPSHEHKHTRSWLSRLFHTSATAATGAKADHQSNSARVKEAAAMPPPASPIRRHPSPHGGIEEAREGLWITLTPTSVSSSPFFDTLLVLVVSPLVTLTVVYALLLLRSRIRRRRWRAPKSIVERLPVRTYHTMPSAATSSSTSSISTPITATTPLLPRQSRPVDARSRPRARTAGDMPHNSSLRSESPVASASLDRFEEKRTSALAEWRRRYGGRQRECVVCLEEYVDGVSRVMSLPCGHEFHAECITPWLTTRRRTCPICKGDVVRSMARSPAWSTHSAAQSDPLLESEHEDGEEGDGREQVEASEASAQERTAVPASEEPSSAQPASREYEPFEDLERGIDPDRNQ